ncbi:MAG: hypothetical protein AAB365_02505 [Patescibacteria group bacterium]
MQTLIHADIFFFVTTIVVILFGIGAVIALVYIIKILALLKDIATTVKTGSGLIAEDIEELRDRVKRGTFNLGAAARFFYGIFRHLKGR